jgi:hypothetical protein
LVLALVAVATFADADSICWRAAPFDDVISMEAVHYPPVGFFVLRDIVWNGAGVYVAMGGGTLVSRSAFDSFVIQATLHHTTTFFGGNPLCNLTAHVGG